MPNTVAQKAVSAQTEVNEVTAVVLHEPARDLVAFEMAEAPVAAEIERRIAEINMSDSNS
ncbi:MAG: toxic anion resistance protein, partial [Rhodobacterales bacterium]|nr:toxic anion resistance protein [Rhodobacterales bacterium]